MSFGRSRSWNIKLIFFLFFLPKMVATTTNSFIKGCSLHGSHHIIIFEAKNSDKSRDRFVTVALNRKMVFLTNESANKAEINILSARDTTRPGP